MTFKTLAAAAALAFSATSAFADSCVIEINGKKHIFEAKTAGGVDAAFDGNQMMVRTNLNRGYDVRVQEVLGTKAKPKVVYQDAVDDGVPDQMAFYRFKGDHTVDFVAVWVDASNAVLFYGYCNNAAAAEALGL